MAEWTGGGAGSRCSLPDTLVIQAECEWLTAVTDGPKMWHTAAAEAASVHTHPGEHAGWRVSWRPERPSEAQAPSVCGSAAPRGLPSFTAGWQETAPARSGEPCFAESQRPSPLAPLLRSPRPEAVPPNTGWSHTLSSSSHPESFGSGLRAGQEGRAAVQSPSREAGLTEQLGGAHR